MKFAKYFRLVNAEIKKETKKACLIIMGMEGHEKETEFWFPLTQVSEKADGIYISEWIINKKSETENILWECFLEDIYSHQ